MSKKILGATVATAAALVFANAPITAHAATGDMVKCYSINSCAGKSACATATSKCKGENKCKGTGFVMKTADQCQAAGGKTKPA